MRQLVTIRTVSELIPIEGADRIELAKVDGWQCVVKKGDFQVGDQGFYFEIDSILPADDERFAFLEQRKFRIKSMKLRGALSQGLLMPMSILTDDEREQLSQEWELSATDNDLTAFFRVQKYEPPLPIAGEQKGTFPTHLVPKTDQERIQNIPEVLAGRLYSEFEVTEKLDGTSCTIFSYVEDVDPHGDVPTEMRIKVGACSRNWEMKLDDQNVYAQMVEEHDLVNKLRKLERSVAIQGEIIGGRIQGNKYKRGQQEFYVFDVYDITARRYLNADERRQLVTALDLRHVPVISYTELNGEMTLDGVLAEAEGKSQLFDTQREGLVFKERNGTLTFKAISNKFLLKNE